MVHGYEQQGLLSLLQTLAIPMLVALLVGYAHWAFTHFNKDK